MQTDARERWERRLETAALLAVAGALVLLTLLDGLHLYHARPLADDFSVAQLGRESGAAGYANSIWAEKSGRWTGHALLALVLGRIDMTWAYPFTVAALALVNLGACWAFLWILLAESVAPRRLLLWALAFQGLMWSGRPAPGQTLYWFSGAVPYQLSISCVVFLVAALVACSRRGHGGPGWVAFTLALPPFIAGLQELIAMMLIVVLAAGAWIAQRLRLAQRRLWWWSLAAAVIGLGVTLAAPGNAARAGDYPQGGDLVLTLRTLVWDGKNAVRDWVLKPRLLAATLFLWLSPTFRALRPRWVEGGVRWAPVVGLAGVLVVAIGLAGPRWATGTWQPLRMLDADYVVLFHAWFALLFVCTRGARGLPGSERVRRMGRVAALAVTGLALVLAGNGRRALGDLAHGRLRRWSGAMDERYELLRAAARQGPADLVLPRPAETPRLYPRMDISDDREDWRNACMARYFGLRSVALEAAAPPDPTPR